MEKEKKSSEMEFNPIRNYHIGDSFYIPARVAEAFNSGEMSLKSGKESDKNPITEAGALFTSEEIIVVLDPPSSLEGFAKVKTISPNGTVREGEMLERGLNLLPPDRRYGRGLFDLSKDRAKEITGIVPEEMKNEKTRFRSTDKDDKINELRVEAGKGVFNINN